MNPEERIALLLQRMKGKVDAMRLTRWQREDLTDLITQIARQTEQLVNERRLLRAPTTQNSDASPYEGPGESKKKKKKGEEEN